MNEPDRLVDKIAELPRAIEPQRDLWAGVEARLEAPRRSRWAELAVAACVAALVSGALFFTVGRGGFGGSADVSIYGQLDAAYLPLRQTALQRYRSQAELLDPELRRSVEENLVIIDRALVQIRATLADHPNDPALRELLLWTHDQELAVIDAVTSQPANADYRGAL